MDNGELDVTGGVPSEVSSQILQACDVIQRHLASTLRAVHLYGSALEGGLKPSSDIDLLVSVNARPGPSIRQALLLDLLKVSAPPGEGSALRALEVTVVALDEVVPWRYPARRELQFGEWLRKDLLQGIFEPAVMDADLAILLTQARRHSAALQGPAADGLFDPVPRRDLFQAFADILDRWQSPRDWAGDQRNVVLALARMWYSVATGEIAPKDVAAGWLMARLPAEHRWVLLEARQDYLGREWRRPPSHADRATAFIRYAKSEIIGLLDANGDDS